MRCSIDIILTNGTVPLALLQQLAKLDEYRGREALYRAQNPHSLEQLVDISRIQSTEASNAIEGITAPSARIKALMKESTTPRNRSEAEIAGYRQALDLIHANHEHIPLSKNVVLQLHKTMLELTGTPGGTFKSIDNTIQETLPDGSKIVRFEPTPAWQTSDAIEQLFTRTNEAIANNKLHTAVVISAFVFDYVCIHPFLDGNGRTSRLLTLLGLYKVGYGVGRYVSLEKIVADTKESYYESLQRSGVGWRIATHDPLPWIEYLVGTLLVAYERFEERVGTLSNHRGAKADAIISFIRARTMSTFTVADVRNAVPTASDAHIRKVLHTLRDAGEIESTGRGRSAAWQRLTD